MSAYKIGASAVLAVFLMAITAPAQEAGQPAATTPASVSLKVKRGQPIRVNPNINRSNSMVIWVYNRLRTTCALPIEVEVHSLSRNTVTLQLEWYFVAKMAENGKLWVYDKGSKSLKLSPEGSTVKEQIESAPVAVVGFNTDRPRSDAGSEPYGYIVQVKENGKIIKSDASPKSLADAARLPNKLKQLLITPDSENPGMPSAGPRSPAPVDQ